jgi:hypothetical protein
MRQEWARFENDERRGWGIEEEDRGTKDELVLQGGSVMYYDD